MNTQKVNFNIGLVQTALKDYRDSIGKETTSCHYINEIRLFRYAMTGDCKSSFGLKNMTEKQSWIASRVICCNRRLIKLHVSYKVRKQACREQVLKYESQT
jgi:hypothetical protein